MMSGPDYREELELDPEALISFIRDWAFSVEINMNDTFHWGCSDSERISVYDLPKILDLEKKYGVAGVDAFVARQRKEGHGSSIVGYYKQDYWDRFEAAKNDLQDYQIDEDYQR